MAVLQGIDQRLVSSTANSSQEAREYERARDAKVCANGVQPSQFYNVSPGLHPDPPVAATTLFLETDQ
jgi:hypothetical protein